MDQRERGLYQIHSIQKNSLSGRQSWSVLSHFSYPTLFFTINYSLHYMCSLKLLLISQPSNVFDYMYMWLCYGFIFDTYIHWNLVKELYNPIILTFFFFLGGVGSLRVIVLCSRRKRIMCALKQSCKHVK